MRNTSVVSSFWVASFLAVSAMAAGAPDAPAQRSGLAIQNAGTRLACVTHNDEPLLAFGCHLEHMFFDDYDYEHWTEWAVRHGMNHCRTRLYHAYYRKYSPFLKTTDGRYDLARWDESFWQRFHKICSYLQSKGIIIHMLIFPQGTGGTWWQGDGYYLARNNVHPETAFIRPQKSTAGFWQSYSKGKRDLYEIQTAILWKLIEETADYDNIYYDICHEPFIRAMKPKAQKDLKEFLAVTTARFVRECQKRRPDKTPILGLDTDFTPPGGHTRLDLCPRPIPPHDSREEPRSLLYHGAGGDCVNQEVQETLLPPGKSRPARDRAHP